MTSPGRSGREPSITPLATYQRGTRRQADKRAAAAAGAAVARDAAAGVQDGVADVEEEDEERTDHPKGGGHPRAAARGVQHSVEGATEPRVGMPSNAIGWQGNNWVHCKPPRC